MKHKNLEPKSGVYRITNLKNGKTYIGSTNNFLRRYKEHLTCFNSKKDCGIVYLANAVKKYGIENFIFEPIAYCHSSVCRKLEQWYLDNVGGEYNLAKIIVQSGAKSPNRKFNDEQIRQIRWLKKEGYLTTDLIIKFKTNKNTMLDILKNRSYTDVEGMQTSPELTLGLRKRQSRASSKVSDEIVRGIRQKAVEGYNSFSLSEMLDISTQAISSIIRKKSYKYITEDGKVDVSWFNEIISRKGDGHFEKNQIPHNKLTTEETEDILRLNRMGRSKAQIHRLTGRSYKVIREILIVKNI